MRTSLLLSSLLLFAACSDNTPTQKSIPAKKVSVVAQKSEITPTKPMPKQEPVAKTVIPVNGHSLYAHKCASCHGQSGEKSALNTSKVIAGWQNDQTTTALKGYQSGTYGSKLKGIMEAQANSLSEAQVEAVAVYISTL